MASNATHLVKKLGAISVFETTVNKTKSSWNIIGQHFSSVGLVHKVIARSGYLSVVLVFVCLQCFTEAELDNHHVKEDKFGWSSILTYSQTPWRQVNYSSPPLNTSLEHTRVAEVERNLNTFISWKPINSDSDWGGIIFIKCKGNIYYFIHNITTFIHVLKLLSTVDIVFKESNFPKQEFVKTNLFTFCKMS